MPSFRPARRSSPASPMSIGGDCRIPQTPDLLKEVVETSDLLEIGDLVQAYADSYQLLAEESP